MERFGVRSVIGAVLLTFMWLWVSAGAVTVILLGLTGGNLLLILAGLVLFAPVVALTTGVVYVATMWEPKE